MKMFSDCTDCKNCEISYRGGCIAGHGDNDFTPLSDETKKMFEKGMSPKEVRQFYKDSRSESSKALDKMFADRIHETVKEIDKRKREK